MILKPIPYEPDERHLREMAGGIRSVAWTDGNLYAMFSASNLASVCGLSSSAIREASYFQKEALQLLAADRGDRKHFPASCSNWIPTSTGTDAGRLGAHASAAP